MKMRRPPFLIFVGLIFFLTLSCSHQAQKNNEPKQTAQQPAAQPANNATANNAEDAKKAPQQFVQSFYDWYVPKDQKDDAEKGWDAALDQKADMFDPDFLKILKEERAAEEKGGDDLDDTLDFDPFLNAQDIAESYSAENVAPKSDTYLVDVYGKWNGEKNNKPDVVPEVALKNGHWVFVNFRYPSADSSENSDLLTMLKNLQTERQKKSK